jgi:hypothetical protein
VGSKAVVTPGVTERPRVFGDESGCTGFNFVKNSSPVYVIALVLTTDVEGFRSAVTSYRSSLPRPPSEFHFRAMEPEQCIQMLTFLGDRKAISFEAYALVVDKVAASRASAPKTNQVYEHYVAMAFDEHRQQITNAIVRMDETNQGGKGVLSRIKKAVNIDPVNQTIHDIQFERSQTSDGIQVADVVCGALWQAYKHNRPEYLDCIRKRVNIAER